MRVTNKMLSNNFLSDMQINLENLKKIQQQMASGKEISKPSDDPVKAARSMQINTDINANVQYNDNISNTINWLDTTDTALGQMGNVVQRVRELMISSGNAGYSTNERKAIKDEINQKIGELSQIMNTNFDGKYLFGGTRGTTKPVSTTGSSDSYKDALEVKVSKVSDWDNKKITFDGKEITIPDKNTSILNLADNINSALKSASLDTNIKAVPSITNNSIIFVNSSKNDIAITGSTLPTGMSAGTLKACTTSNLSNTSLIYNDRDGEEMPESIVASASDISKWKGKSIQFNEDNGTTTNEISVTIPDTITKTQDIADSINNNTTKIHATVVKDTNGNDCIKFANLTNNKITIEKPASGELPTDLNDFVSKEVPDAQKDMISSKLKVEVSQGVTMDYNVTATDIIEYGEGKDLRSLLKTIVNHLDGNNADGTAADSEAVKKLTNDDLTEITNAMNNLLKIRSEVGAKQNRMDSAKDKNEDENYNMTEILSKTEDIDITQKTMEYATMQTVYTASLQVSARVLQPSLMDYLR